MNVEEIKQKIATDTYDDVDRGNWCLFIPLGNGWGAKFYSTKEERDWACIAQECAAEKGVAP